jgi:hypothetical protein
MKKKEIKVNKAEVKNIIKLVIISSIISFILMLIVAIFGEILPRPTYTTDDDHTEILSYNGLLSKDDYINIHNKPHEGIKYYLGYYLGDLHPGSYDPNQNYDKMRMIQPLENERWSIPNTFITKARTDSTITFRDKFLIIYIPLILSKNFLTWIILSICIFFAFKLKNRYQLKFV